VLLCRAARIAVAGYYPLIFPGHGQHGLAWLGETAAALGPQALTVLKAACREGEVLLPTRVQIKLSDGIILHLGPDLTCPSETLVKRCPDISVTKDKKKITVIHKEVKPEEEKDEGYLPEDGTEDEEGENDDVDKEQDDPEEEAAAAVLRLRGGEGGSGRPPGVPVAPRPPAAPRQLQQALNPFRLLTAHCTQHALHTLHTAHCTLH
jgi:hypothetical protein